jgi:hypothetical protein
MQGRGAPQIITNFADSLREQGVEMVVPQRSKLHKRKTWRYVNGAAMCGAK